MNFSHHKKYQKEGGPDFEAYIRLTRDHLSLLEVNSLINWYLFNLLAGNSDAHGKNLSILYKEDGSLQLAPFYDLVCTRAYDRLDRKLAMACGPEYDPDLIGPKQLNLMAEQIGVTHQFILQRFQQITQKFPAAIQLASEDFHKRGFTERDIQHVLQSLRKTHQHFARNFGFNLK
ncbi:MAG: HipA domain-containing protein [Proteobacteria bacterium]|nr:HipA domain-containing protein [Pseudomonadota bacterium]